MAATQRQVEAKPLEEVFSMSKGEDNDSYAKNSDVQKDLVDAHALPRLDEALQHVTLPPAGKAIVVADLGCSSGPNSIRWTSHIVETLRARLSDPREVLAFFNDLPSNDFNTLFQRWGSEIAGSFFAAGVPGSFFNRIFLRSSVHVMFSSFCVHFLSEIPAALYDLTSPAFNGDHLYIDDAPPSARELVEKQSAVDLEAFLHARAAELAPGGLLLFIAKGSGYSGNGPRRYLREDDAFDVSLNALIRTWNELRSKGLLTKEHTAAFNVPAYWRSLDEVKKGLDSCNSEFHAQKVDMIKAPLFADAVKSRDRARICKVASGFWRGILGGYVEGIIGKENATIYWDTFERLIERDYLPQLSGDTYMYVVSMIRK